MSVLADALQTVLDRSARAHDVPGATAGVLTAHGVEVAATGVLNLETGVEVTPDAIFQIGSITKVYTATVIMRLVACGRLDLDAPVRDVLGGFRVADPEVSARVTARHLLSHTSGIAGDDFTDTGRGDDCLERYVASISHLGQDVPLATMMSYSNTGYAILGRIIEVLTDRTFDAALRELLIEPLGLHATVTLPEEVLRFRAAWSHIGGGDDGPVRAAPFWSAAVRSMGPAGGICASAADVLRFARMHLDDGALPDGDGAADGRGRLLSADLARAMREPQVPVPDPWSGGGSHWGLGWILDEYDGHRGWGHDGSTGGQASRLWVVPDADVAIVLLTNGGDVEGVWDDLRADVLETRFGVPTRPRPAPAPDPLTPGAARRLIGRYERHGIRIEVAPPSAEDGEVRATLSVIEPLASQLPYPEPPQSLIVRGSDAGTDVFMARATAQDPWLPMIVAEVGGRRYLHTGARAQAACTEAGQ